MNTLAEHRLEVAASWPAPANLTDAEFELVDRLEVALAELGDATPSKVARKVGIATHEANRLLGWLVRNSYAHTSGNGCWTHFHPGRGW